MTEYKEKAFDLVHCYTRYDRTDTEVLVDVVAVLLERIEKLENSLQPKEQDLKDSEVEK